MVGDRKNKKIAIQRFALIILVCSMCLGGCKTALSLNNENNCITEVSCSNTTDLEMVWIPRTGKRYHRNKACSDMENPREVTIEEAVDLGFTPCGNCC